MAGSVISHEASLAFRLALVGLPEISSYSEPVAGSTLLSGDRRARVTLRSTTRWGSDLMSIGRTGWRERFVAPDGQGNRPCPSMKTGARSWPSGLYAGCSCCSCWLRSWLGHSGPEAARGSGSRASPRGPRCSGPAGPAGRHAARAGGSRHGLGGRRRTRSGSPGPRDKKESVRILGIDSPEVRHKHDPIPTDQPHGPESLTFARKWILGARRLELMRASHRDRYGRTLGYLFVDGVNYSVLAIEHHMASNTYSSRRT